MRLPQAWSLGYHKLDAENKTEADSQDHEHHTMNASTGETCQTASRANFRHVISIVALVAAFAMIVTFGVLSISTTRLRRSGQDPMHPCGNSSAEAVSLGCTWDQLTWSWLPFTCPHYANDEFLQAEDWKFFTDPQGTHEAVGEVWAHALDNHVGLWGQRREHLTHCVYLFLSLGQVIRDGGGHHQRLTGYEHVHHCSEILLEALRQDKNWYSMETSTGRVSYEEHCQISMKPVA